MTVSFSGPGLWYATRATGLVSLLLLTASVLLGVLTAGRFATPRWPRFLTVGLHRNVSLLAVVFLILHVGTTVLDSYTSIQLSAAFIPFISGYKRVWVGLGAVALDLLIALIVPAWAGCGWATGPGGWCTGAATPAGGRGGACGGRGHRRAPVLGGRDDDRLPGPGRGRGRLAGPAALARAPRAPAGRDGRGRGRRAAVLGAAESDGEPGSSCPFPPSPPGQPALRRLPRLLAACVTTGRPAWPTTSAAMGRSRCTGRAAPAGWDG